MPPRSVTAGKRRDKRDLLFGLQKANFAPDKLFYPGSMDQAESHDAMPALPRLTISSKTQQMIIGPEGAASDMQCRLYFFKRFRTFSANSRWSFAIQARSLLS